ncbi:MAG: hypothetical protein JWO77_3698 [Ilumatobacteraceae bacterium]|nr:hypothetical protein [Ilumatobacteraceae bacterium]
MSRMRTLGAGVLAVALLLSAAACSSDDKKTAANDRGKITFQDPPKGSNDIGLCYAYELDQIKDLIGGEENFKRLPPAAIGKDGDAVHGETCAWQRTEPNGDSLNLRIEIRDFGKDQAALLEQYADLQDGTIGAADVADLGDGAFSSSTEETSLLQVKSGPYLLTLSSRAEGKLEPIDVPTLQLLAASGLDQIK